MPLLPALPAGHAPTGSEYKAISDQINSLTAPGWTSWTGSWSWTSAGTAPALGNGVLNFAEYRLSDGGDMADVIFSVTWGTTSTFGTNVWFFATPLSAATNQSGVACGWAWAVDTGIKEAGGLVKMDTTSRIRIACAPSTASTFSNWSASDPYGWGNGDTLTVGYRMRKA
jgi:hypothetical protein